MVAKIRLRKCVWLWTRAWGCSSWEGEDRPPAGFAV